MFGITINDLDLNKDLTVSWEVDDGYMGHGSLETTVDWSDIADLVYDNLPDFDDDKDPEDVLSYAQSDDVNFDEEAFNNDLNDLVEEYVNEDFECRISWCNLKVSR